MADFELTEFCSDGESGNKLDSVVYIDVQASRQPSGCSGQFLYGRIIFETQ